MPFHSTVMLTHVWEMKCQSVFTAHRSCSKAVLSCSSLVYPSGQDAIPVCDVLQLAPLWKLRDMNLLKASVKMSLASAWDFPRVADDLLTAGYIILTISHMISFRKDFKNSHTSKSSPALWPRHNENIPSWNTTWHLVLLCSCQITLN